MSRSTALSIEVALPLQVRDDPLWKGIKVIYSGHEVPGEGEHKIIKYIRHRKAQADWNPGERHCM